MRLLLAGLLFAGATHAQGQSPVPETLLTTLSRCDAVFFKELLANRDQLQAQAPVQIRGGSGTFQVPDASHPTASKIFFASPLRFMNLNLIGYFDEVAPIPGGVAVSWGFLISSSVAEVGSSLRNLIWESSRLRHGDGYFVRSEIWSHSNPSEGWTRGATVPGPPKRGTVERVFMIEPYDGEFAYVRAGCSLQGEVSREMMNDLRPDFVLRGKLGITGR